MSTIGVVCKKYYRITPVLESEEVGGGGEGG